MKRANSASTTRSVLGNELPLASPYLVQIFPVYGCNFRCEYCLHSLPRPQHGYISARTFIDIDLYKKAIDDISKLPKKLKMLRFAGIGEPLLHKDLPEMIRYAKERDVAQTVDVVTNGALLTKELSLALIDSGLDRLRISIQGTSPEKYLKVAQARVDFAEFLANLRFFYQQKTNTEVYIKIIDCALDGEEDKRLFLNLFGETSDIIAVEHLAPAVKEIDYERLAGGKTLELTQNGNALLDIAICSQPFYMLQINPDGAIVPCCSMKYPCVIDNVQDKSLLEIWNGEKLNEFRRKMLNGTEHAGQTCSECLMYKYGVFPEDVLDSYVERLKDVY